MAVIVCGWQVPELEAASRVRIVKCLESRVEEEEEESGESVIATSMFSSENIHRHGSGKI